MILKYSTGPVRISWPWKENDLGYISSLFVDSHSGQLFKDEMVIVSLDGAISGLLWGYILLENTTAPRRQLHSHRSCSCADLENCSFLHVRMCCHVCIRWVFDCRLFWQDHVAFFWLVTAWLNVTAVRAVALCQLQLGENVAKTLDIWFQVKKQNQKRTPTTLQSPREHVCRRSNGKGTTCSKVWKVLQYRRYWRNLRRVCSVGIKNLVKVGSAAYCKCHLSNSCWEMVVKQWQMLQLEVEAQLVLQEAPMNHWKTTQRGKVWNGDSSKRGRGPTVRDRNKRV